MKTDEQNNGNAVQTNAADAAAQAAANAASHAAEPAAAPADRPADAPAKTAPIAANPAQTAQVAADAAGKPAAPAAKPAPPTAKAEKKQKDPAAPTLVPFQMISQHNRERLAAIGKADDKTLAELLDAYENRSLTAEGADSNTGKLLNQIKQLKQQIAAQQQQLSAKDQQIAAASAAAAAAKSAAQAAEAGSDAAETVQLQQVEIAAQQQTIADREADISRLKQELEQAKQQIAAAKAAAPAADPSANTAAEQQIADLQKQLKDCTDRATRAEEAEKDYRKQLNGLQEIKAELEKQLKAAKKKAVTPTLPADALPEQYLNHYSDGDILHFFPTITAKMLELTAERMTAVRKDGQTVTPTMILGDMFNRYTIERWNLWFYKWVLEDKDIIRIAQEVEPKLDSLRKLRAALKIQ